MVLRHAAGRSGVEAARQLSAHCRDELEYSPPAVRVRMQPGRRVEKCRGDDENREESGESTPMPKRHELKSHENGKGLYRFVCCRTGVPQKPGRDATRAE